MLCKQTSQPAVGHMDSIRFYNHRSDVTIAEFELHVVPGGLASFH